MRDSKPALVEKSAREANVEVEILNVSHRYNNVEALKNVSLQVHQGEFLTLLGGSGSGKTTLLRIIAGLVLPSDGTVLIRGRDVTFARPQKRDIGFIFQHYALFPHLTVFDNIAYPLRVRGVPAAEIKSRVEQALDRVNLVDVGGRSSRQLSGGQQQRVAIARALVYEPAVLLMDEPLGALDRRLRAHMQVELRQLQRRLGLTCIYVTHDQEEALTMSDRIGVMRDGQLIQLDEPRALYRSPVDHFVAGFVGETNLFECSVRRADADTIEVCLAENDCCARLAEANNAGDVPPVGPALLAVRPESLVLDDASADFALEATVVETLFLGNVAVLICESKSGARIRVQIPAIEQPRYPLGKALRIGWHGGQAKLLRSRARTDIPNELSSGEPLGSRI